MNISQIESTHIHISSINELSTPQEIDFNLAIWDLFNRCHPIAGNNSLIVEGAVLGDGLGDYAHMQSFKRILHKKFPNRKIISYIISNETHKGKIVALNNDWSEEHISYSKEVNSSGCPTLSETPFEEDIEETLKKIRQADLWISGPISTLGLFDSLLKESASKKMIFDEYNFLINQTNIKVKNKVPMGLKTSNYGISLKKSKQISSFFTIDNQIVKNIVFKSENPSQEAIEGYLSTNAPFFAYMNNVEDLGLFAEAATKFAQANYTAKNIDIFIPAKSKTLIAYYLKSIETKEDIKSLTGCYEEKGSRVEKKIEFLKMGIELRLIDTGFLSPKDFQSFNEAKC